MDVGRVVGLGHDLGMAICTDLSEAIERTRPDVAIHATCSTIEGADGEITALVGRGVHVISIAEEMAYPACRASRWAEQVHAQALEHGVGVLGTGINPGFVMDFLVIALTGVCADVEMITVRRVNDLSPYGPTVLRSQGIGLTPEAFQAGLEDGSVVGHVGFDESIHMIAHAVGWRIERIEQTREPIVATKPRETASATVNPGQVAGCRHTATAYRDGRPVIRLIHPQQVQPGAEGEETEDFIEVSGTPSLTFRGTPEIPGGQATVALAVNMIPRLLNAGPGLFSMADLPPPAAMLGDVRAVLHDR
jgi:4-hydroxy-tetrahydrodipicolinate reductase